MFQKASSKVWPDLMGTVTMYRVRVCNTQKEWVQNISIVVVVAFLSTSTRVQTELLCFACATVQTTTFLAFYTMLSRCSINIMEKITIALAV